jgi:hypothetical protein
MSKIEVFKYRDYPDGSPHKMSYDFYHLPFQDYLDKYYKNPDLSRWEYIYQKFIMPLFDGTDWADYTNFLYHVKPSFAPVEDRKNDFWELVISDDRFSKELKCFFSFLYSINFFRELSFEEWLKSNNWMHPWYNSEVENVKSISELLKYQHSENYIKILLSGLNIF